MVAAAITPTHPRTHKTWAITLVHYSWKKAPEATAQLYIFLRREDTAQQATIQGK